MGERKATITRNTKETEITCTLNIDGTGKLSIDTGIEFFDHMLSGFARHGLFDLDIKCKGDTGVDSHHSIEDCGIVIGEAIKQALGDKKGIKRYGSIMLPMDDALIACAVDMSGRPYFNFDLKFTAPMLGQMQTEMVRDFFYSISYAASMNLHLKEMDGINDHHIAEAAFKAFGKALDSATQIEERLGDTAWTTKGTL